MESSYNASLQEEEMLISTYMTLTEIGLLTEIAIYRIIVLLLSSVEILRLPVEHIIDASKRIIRNTVLDLSHLLSLTAEKTDMLSSQF